MTARDEALRDAVRVRPSKRGIGLLMGTLDMLDDGADTYDERIEAGALRALIDMNARIGIALAFDDEKIATVLRRS